MREFIVFCSMYDIVVKKSSRSLSHLLMSFLLKQWRSHRKHEENEPVPDHGNCRDLRSEGRNAAQGQFWAIMATVPLSEFLARFGDS